MQAAGIKARPKRRQVPGQLVIGRAFGSAQPAGSAVPGIRPQSDARVESNNMKSIARADALQDCDVTIAAAD